jgi:hypothetical protein
LTLYVHTPPPSLTGKRKAKRHYTAPNLKKKEILTQSPAVMTLATKQNKKKKKEEFGILRGDLVFRDVEVCRALILQVFASKNS